MSTKTKENKNVAEAEMIKATYKGSEKLKGKIALVTGGNSGIGRAICMHLAREGAHVAFTYYHDEEEGAITKKMILKEGVQALMLQADVSSYQSCDVLLKEVLNHFGKVDILINNAGIQFTEAHVEDITIEHLEQTFRTNILGMIYLTKQLVPHLKSNARIINTASVNAYRGHKLLVDYTATKGAIVSFTRALSKQLASKNILVNGVAPGPIWTPLIPQTMDDIDHFGEDTPMGRPGQPSEVAPAYVYLASEDSTYMTGQVLHVNGGEVVGG